MAHTPHELHEEFPDLADKITELKTGDAHFARLADEYHALNRAVHRAETNVEPISPVAETDMRKQRASLKDELYRMLTE
ncbi:MAG: YdcH family protein [Pseudomonadota bacterium]